MQIFLGATASKTKAMYFPPPRQAFAAAVTSRFLVIGTEFIELSGSFKDLGSIIHYSLTSDAEVYKRIKSATAAFGALKKLFGDKCLSEKVKGQVYTALILSTLLYDCEVLSLCAFFFSKFGVSETVEPAACVGSASPRLPATASPPKASFAVWVSWISAATTTAESCVGLATSQACP
jgi:hypothetical protein